VHAVRVSFPKVALENRVNYKSVSWHKLYPKGGGEALNKLF